MGERERRYEAIAERSEADTVQCQGLISSRGRLCMLHLVHIHKF